MTGTSANPGPPPAKRKIPDGVAVVAVALLLIVVFVGGGVWVELHGVPHSWVFAGMAAIGFALVIGWQTRSLFKRRWFVPYFIVWVAALTGGMVFLLARYGTIAAAPAVLLIIFLGFAVTFAIFGVPPELRRKRKTSSDDAPKE